MKKIFFTISRLSLFSLILLMLCSCQRIKNKTKETINSGGEMAGRAATEFVEGVTDGVESTLACELIVGESLKQAGLISGAFEIENAMNGGTNNKLSVYLGFNEKFRQSVTAKAFNKKGQEIGRSEIKIFGGRGESGYFDFVFDERTSIEAKGKIILE